MNLGVAAAAKAGTGRAIPIALVQFDAVPEQVDHNTAHIQRLTRQAVSLGARWVMFHEGTLCDYTGRLNELAEPVPSGKHVQHIEQLARQLQCFISYGLSEVDHGRYYIAQVFTGPQGFIYKYRKTWLWHDRGDRGFRDEWQRYDTGTGPDLFAIDGVRASCFICSDGESKRCLSRIAGLKVQVVFHPNNRASFPHWEEYSARARTLGAPMLVTNRVGQSWLKETPGASAVFSASGDVLARANADGKEEVLRYDLNL